MYEFKEDVKQTPVEVPEKVTPPEVVFTQNEPVEEPKAPM